MNPSSHLAASRRSRRSAPARSAASASRSIAASAAVVAASTSSGTHRPPGPARRPSTWASEMYRPRKRSLGSASSARRRSTAARTRASTSSRRAKRYASDASATVRRRSSAAGGGVDLAAHAGGRWRRRKSGLGGRSRCRRGRLCLGLDGLSSSSEVDGGDDPEHRYGTRRYNRRSLRRPPALFVGAYPLASLQLFEIDLQLHQVVVVERRLRVEPVRGRNEVLQVGGRRDFADQHGEDRFARVEGELDLAQHVPRRVRLGREEQHLRGAVSDGGGDGGGKAGARLDVARRNPARHPGLLEPGADAIGDGRVLGRVADEDPARHLQKVTGSAPRRPPRAPSTRRRWRRLA